jgi:hypothetical protein
MAASAIDGVWAEFPPVGDSKNIPSCGEDMEGGNLPCLKLDLQTVKYNYPVPTSSHGPRPRNPLHQGEPTGREIGKVKKGRFV